MKYVKHSKINVKNKFPYFYDPKKKADNLKYIRDRIYEGAEIVAVWDTHIQDRDFFIEILEEINHIVKEKMPIGFV